jgi:hypothetical protein
MCVMERLWWLATLDRYMEVGAIQASGCSQVRRGTVVSSVFQGSAKLVVWKDAAQRSPAVQSFSGQSRQSDGSEPADATPGFALKASEARWRLGFCVGPLLRLRLAEACESARFKQSMTSAPDPVAMHSSTRMF